MNNLLVLSIFTLAAWLVHSGLASLYIQMFSSTASISFRVVHAAEIFITVTVMLVLFSILITNTMATFTVVGIILSTLLVLDAAMLLLLPQLRSQFDSLHFIVAYLSVVLASSIVTEIT